MANFPSDGLRAEFLIYILQPAWVNHQHQLEATHVLMVFEPICEQPEFTERLHDIVSAVMVCLSEQSHRLKDPNAFKPDGANYASLE